MRLGFHNIVEPHDVRMPHIFQGWVEEDWWERTTRMMRMRESGASQGSGLQRRHTHKHKHKQGKTTPTHESRPTFGFRPVLDGVGLGRIHELERNL